MDHLRGACRRPSTARGAPTRRASAPCAGSRSWTSKTTSRAPREAGSGARRERAAGLAGPGMSLGSAGRGREEATDCGRIGFGGPAVGAVKFANCHDSDCAWLAWRAAASWHGPFWRITEANDWEHDQTGTCLRNQTWPCDIWHVHYDK